MTSLPYLSPEKRKDLRIPISELVHIATATNSSLGKIVNISMEGMMLKIDSKLIPGEWIQVFFRLPYVNHDFWLEGVVVWISSTVKQGASGTLGIRFHNVQEEDRIQLRKFIDLKRRSKED